MSEFILDNEGIWLESVPVMDKEGNEKEEWIVVPITNVPVECLLQEYEDLVLELSRKEVELYNLKEAYLIAERKIVETTDFKAIYNKNNADIRKQHVKQELSDMYEQLKSLEFSIAFIGRYIGLLKEVVRGKTMISRIKTKFGDATLNTGGYYRICTTKEGNGGKLLHRLIFEDFYQCNLDEEFPEGVVVHHIDGNRTNNEIWNLDLMPLKEHTSMHKTGERHHQYGKSPSHETKLKQSGTTSKTGYYHVNKRKDLTCSQGFIWVYHYKGDDGKTKYILRVNLKDLKEKVLEEGLDWKIVNEEKAKECGLI